VVLEVVREARAEVAERLGDPRDALVADVAPDPAVVERLRGEDRVIGVDHVSGVQEERRLGVADRAVAAQAAPLGVAAEALAAGVAGPCEADAIGARRREPTGGPGAGTARGFALEADPVADGLRVG